MSRGFVTQLNTDGLFPITITFHCMSLYALSRIVYFVYIYLIQFCIPLYKRQGYGPASHYVHYTKPTGHFAPHKTYLYYGSLSMLQIVIPLNWIPCIFSRKKKNIIDPLPVTVYAMPCLMYSGLVPVHSGTGAYHRPRTRSTKLWKERREIRKHNCAPPPQ